MTLCLCAPENNSTSLPWTKTTGQNKFIFLKVFLLGYLSEQQKLTNTTTGNPSKWEHMEHTLWFPSHSSYCVNIYQMPLVLKSHTESKMYCIPWVATQSHQCRPNPLWIRFLFSTLQSYTTAKLLSLSYKYTIYFLHLVPFVLALLEHSFSSHY